MFLYIVQFHKKKIIILIFISGNYNVDYLARHFLFIHRETSVISSYEQFADVRTYPRDSCQ